MCAGKDALLRVGAFIIVRRYSYDWVWHSVTAFGAGALVINDHRREAALLAEHAHETESLARTVDALTARLSAIDSAKAHDELIELRRSVGEIR